MKRLLIATVVVGVVLAAVGIAASEEKGHWGRRGHGRRPALQAGDTNACPLADADVRRARDPNGPRRRRGAHMMKNALDKRIARLESIRAIAAAEGATKTVEALNKLIAEDKERFEHRAQKMRRMRGKRRGDFEGEKAEGKWHNRHRGPHRGGDRGPHRHRHGEPPPEPEPETVTEPEP
ncbi:MAG: hypothetical protein ACYSUP_00255 [Planctomycetota bacterium]